MIGFRRVERTDQSQGGFSPTAYGPASRSFQTALEEAIVERREGDRRRQPRTTANPSYERMQSDSSIAWIRMRGGRMSISKPPHALPVVRIPIEAPTEAPQPGEWLDAEQAPGNPAIANIKRATRPPRTLNYGV